MNTRRLHAATHILALAAAALWLAPPARAAEFSPNFGFVVSGKATLKIKKLPTLKQEVTLGIGMDGGMTSGFWQAVDDDGAVFLGSYYFSHENQREFGVVFHPNSLSQLGQIFRSALFVAIDGVPVSGVFPIEVTGSVKGVAGDGVTPKSKLELRMRAHKVTLTVNGEARQAELSASLAGVIDHTGSQFTAKGKRTLAIKGSKKSAGKIAFPLSNPARIETWTLEVSVDPANNSKLSGSAVLSHEAVGWFAFGFRGSESKKTGLAKLSLRPGKRSRGASLRIDDLEVTQGSARFELEFKLFGLKGVLSSQGPNVSWLPFRDDWHTQGTPWKPLELNGVAPFHGTVGDSGDSVYVVRGLKPGRQYVVELERLAGVTDFVQILDFALGCGNGVELGITTCNAGLQVSSPTGGVVIRVGATYTPTRFTLDVQ